MKQIKIQLLEWSDTRLRFKDIKEIENWVSYSYDLSELDDYLLVIQFDDDRILEVKGTIEWETIVFDIFWEQTENHEWNFKADLWWLKGVKKIRFNSLTIKWKILHSVTVPTWLTDAD